MKYAVLSATLGILITATACSSDHTKNDEAILEHKSALSTANHDDKPHDMGAMDKTDAAPENTIGADVNLTEALSLEGAYVRPPFPGRDIAAGFFVLNNTGADDRLIAATSLISPSIEIHTHLKEDGVMKMRRIEGVDVAKGQSIPFAPGTYHLMLFNTVLADTDTQVDITLEFEKAGQHTVTVPIEGRDETSATMDHSNH